MHGVVRHVEVERLAVGHGPVHGLIGLDGQGLGQINILAMVLIQPGHVPYPTAFAEGGAVVVLAEVAAGPASRVSGDVDVEAQVPRILAGRTLGPEMGLAHVNRPIAGLLQQHRQRHGMHGSLHARLGTQSVEVPVGRLDYRMIRVGRAVFAQRPVGNPVPNRAQPGHQAHPRRRADRTRVCLRKLHPLRRQPLHIRRPVAPIELSDFRMERHRRILPAHVVDKEEDDVGARRLGGRGSARHAGHQADGSNDNHNTTHRVPFRLVSTSASLRLRALSFSRVFVTGREAFVHGMV